MSCEAYVVCHELGGSMSYIRGVISHIGGGGVVSYIGGVMSYIAGVMSHIGGVMSHIGDMTLLLITTYNLPEL